MHSREIPIESRQQINFIWKNLRVLSQYLNKNYTLYCKKESINKSGKKNLSKKEKKNTHRYYNEIDICVQALARRRETYVN
ncbi:hypothetical protein PUN28_004421 [Cardiocondyla obscurior]|uniref:Uncharacterized protein n=1 Tax=Cardiocondyla obscurior TaxID=286306 RepID=A0AAW2GAP6_9HYME